MNLLFSILFLALSFNSTKTKTKVRTQHRKMFQVNSFAQPNLMNSKPANQPLLGKQLVTQGSGFIDCDCAVSFKCPTCGPDGQAQPSKPCPCMEQPTCPNCVMGKLLKQFHEKSASIAKKDAQTQNKLALESMLEKKLFDQAEKYAQEAAAEEKQAKEAVVILQEHASKAALARGKMIRAENQAKQVAAKALQTITSTTSQKLLGDSPNIFLTQTGTRHVAITQNTPEYQINVGVGSGDGYFDAVNQEIKNDADHFHFDNSAGATAQEQPLIPQQQIGLVSGTNTVQGQVIQNNQQQ